MRIPGRQKTNRLRFHPKNQLGESENGEFSHNDKHQVILSVKLTANLPPENRPPCPKRKRAFSIETIHFQVAFAVSCREGISWIFTSEINVAFATSNQRHFESLFAPRLNH